MLSGGVGVLHEIRLAAHAVEVVLHAIHWRSRGQLLCKRVSAIWLYRLSALVECQQFLEVVLQHPEAGVYGRCAESVRQETEVGEARVGIVRVHRFDVAGSSHCVQHRLHLRHNQPTRNEKYTILSMQIAVIVQHLLLLELLYNLLPDYMIKRVVSMVSLPWMTTGKVGVNLGFPPHYLYMYNAQGKSIRGGD